MVTIRPGDDLWHITQDRPAGELVTVDSVDERRGVFAAGSARFSLKTRRGVRGTEGRADVAGINARMGAAQGAARRIIDTLSALGWKGDLPPREAQARLLRLLRDTEREVARILRGEP